MFVTFDYEYADPKLKSICSLAILTWKNGIVVDEYKTLIYPDCDVEESMTAKHGLTNDMLKDAPTLPMVWKEIYRRLDSNIVFAHKANVVFTDLIIRAEVDYLSMPNVTYADTLTLSKRIWPHFNDFSLPGINKRLMIIDKSHVPENDAYLVGHILLQAFKDCNVDNYNDLFYKTGYAGGFIHNNNKIIYRAIKDKKGGYIARIKLPKETTFKDNFTNAIIEE